MKTYLFITLAFLLISHSIFGKIINGYDPEFLANELSLKNLKTLLTNHNISTTQRRLIKNQIDNLNKFFSYHKVTKEAIALFHNISPEMFTLVDTIQDKKGRPTDIYIKLIPRESSAVSLSGVSFFNSLQNDEDANLSKYGPFSVAIDIWICDKALILLSHELGHVSYIVPNLASYTRFYKKQPVFENVGLYYAGHSPSDKSGKLANDFVEKFVQDRKIYTQDIGRKPERITSIFSRIRKDIAAPEDHGVPTIAASNAQ